MTLGAVSGRDKETASIRGRQRCDALRAASCSDTPRMCGRHVLEEVYNVQADFVECTTVWSGFGFDHARTTLLWARATA